MLVALINYLDSVLGIDRVRTNTMCCQLVGAGLGLVCSSRPGVGAAGPLLAR